MQFPERLKWSIDFGQRGTDFGQRSAVKVLKQ
jgi:hypothetical protein